MHNTPEGSPLSAACQAEASQGYRHVWRSHTYSEQIPFRNVGDLRPVRGVQVRLIERDVLSGTAAFQVVCGDEQYVLKGKQGGALRKEDDGREYSWRLGSVSNVEAVLIAVYSESSGDTDPPPLLKRLSENEETIRSWPKEDADTRIKGRG